MNRNHGERLAFNRRRFVECCTAFGLGGTLLPGTLTAVAQGASEITSEMVQAAAELAGLEFARADLERIAESFNGAGGFLQDYDRMRREGLDNSVPPALVFKPLLPSQALPGGERTLKPGRPRVSRPALAHELAYLPVTHLSQLLRRRAVSSEELTRLYLERLRHFDPRLHCVITLTERLALEQARDADREIRAGRYQGPLHGIPFGLKDLIAVRGYPTTWGASPYRDQMISTDATVYTRLREAGAVLVGKLSLGALAIGDRWFGGQTKSPWDPDNPERGSSGSSAGSAAATAAGLVGFSIGSETRGSIISPAGRCGVTGLRPTFGRVSRHGAMTLSWTMDKLGPICRSAEDCALVLHAIQGPDGQDNTVLDVPFSWNAAGRLSRVRVGVLSSLLRPAASRSQDPEVQRAARETAEVRQAALGTFRSLDIELKEVELPELPTRALGFILSTESSAAFDDLMRSGRDEPMRGDPERSVRPDRFRLHRLVPAVEYLQANRIRFRLMQKVREFFDREGIDLFVGSDLSLTNLTGHPEITFPCGFTGAGQPVDLSLTGNLFEDSRLVLVAHRFQQATRHHLRHPSGFEGI